MDDSMFQELLASVKQAGAIKRGEITPSRVTEIAVPEAKLIREKAHLSQSEFAQLLGVPVKTLQNWEQHRTKPTGPARALLRALEKDTATALKLLAA